MNKFIVIEGLDGSGLSTQTEKLGNYLREGGVPVLVTKEPTNGLIGQLIRQILQGKHIVSPLTFQLLYIADRAEHLDKVIMPALREGKTVVCDRYFFSTLAMGGLEVEKNFLRQANNLFRRPDAVFLLDVPAEVCIERIAKSRDGFEYFEKLEKLEGARENYLEMVEEFGMEVIDGQQKPEVVFEIIKAGL